MSIILLTALSFAAFVASVVIVVRWALARGRPTAGFPIDDPAAQIPRTDESPR